MSEIAYLTAILRAENAGLYALADALRDARVRAFLINAAG